MGDHRTLFIDVNIEELIGGTTEDPIGVPPRGFRLQNVKAMDRYISQLTDYFQQHRIREELAAISKGLSNSSKIQKLITSSSFHGEIYSRTQCTR